jgi:hypothetical protein
MYDGSICSVCGGLGVSSTSNDEYDGDYDDDDIFDDVPEFYDGYAKGGGVKNFFELPEEMPQEWQLVEWSLNGHSPSFKGRMYYQKGTGMMFIQKEDGEIWKQKSNHKLFWRNISYANGGQVAQTILQQLGGAGRLNAMTGAYNFIDRGNGLSFKIKNARANYIKITLNANDLYDVEVGRIRGNTYKVVKEANDLYFDQLKPFIEESTGMYLSLFGDGGEVKIKAKKVELKTLDGKKFYKETKFLPDFIWASPPCNTFSPLAYPLKERNTQTAEPYSERAKTGTKILYKTLEIINYFLKLNPNMGFVIENPRGMMRKDKKMEKLNRETTLYCYYGDIKRKPTDFWSNFDMKLKPIVDKCSNNNIVGVVDLPLNKRYSIPSKLIKQILSQYL